MRGLKRRAGWAFGLASVVVATAFAGSASAAVTNLELVHSSEQEAPATATCPPGKRVLGGTGYLEANTSGGQVTFRNIRPNPELTAVHVQGLEDENGAASTVFTHAHAFCATPPPGLERVVVASASTSANKSVTAPCPAGKALLGAGGEIAGGAGQVAVDDIKPGFALSGVTVGGDEDENGFAGSWSVTAYAICAVPPAGLEAKVETSATDSDWKLSSPTCSEGKQLIGTGAELGGGAGRVIVGFDPQPGLDSVLITAGEDENGTATNWFVRGYAICAATAERVQATNTTVSASKSKTATCPEGLTATGGGGEIVGGAGAVLLSELSVAGASFRAFGDYFGPDPPPPIGVHWDLRAYAICGTPLPGSQRVVASTGLSDNDELSKQAVCPAGKQVVGGGGRVSGGQGEVVLTQVEPDPLLSRITARALQTEDSPGGFDWRLYAYAVCADPPPGLELVTTSNFDPSDTSVSATASCPAGKHLVGAGGKINIATGDVVMDDLRPNPSLTTVTVTGIEDGDGAAGVWDVWAHAICVSA